MKKRIVAMMMVLNMVTSMLVGCGNSEDNVAKLNDADAEESSTEENSTGETVNLPLDGNGNPSGEGKYEEAVTVEIAQSIDPTVAFPEGESATDNYYTRYIKENMNVDVSLKWSAANSDYSEKLNLAIASGDIPDIFVVNERQLIALAEADMLEDLTPYYEVYACERIKMNMDARGEAAFNQVTFDGKMLALPSMNAEGDACKMMWIRQDWLDALELEVPTTMEELETVAQAFVDNEMGGENTVGILVNELYSSFNSVGNNFTLDGIFSAYNAFPGFWIEGEDGNVVYGSITSETKDVLGKLNELYEKGILDQELSTRSDANEAWKSGTVGIMFFPWWLGYNDLISAVSLNPEMDWKAYASPLAEDGLFDVKDSGVCSGSYAVVRKGYEHPELVFMLNNALIMHEQEWLEETTLDIDLWPGRVNIAPLDEIWVSYYVMQEEIDGEYTEYDEGVYRYVEIDRASVAECIDAPYDDFSIEKWDIESSFFGRAYSMFIGSGALTRAKDDGILNIIHSTTYSMTDTMEKKWANLEKKEDEVFLKIILGEEPLDAFDTFVEEWKAEGGDEITSEVQALADRN